MGSEVTIVQNAPREDLGLLAPHVPAARVARAFAGEAVPDAPGAGLVVLGGPASVHEPASAPWMEDVMRLVRRAHAARVPVLGVCLGAQLVAHALGGRAFRGHAPEVGFRPVRASAAGDALLDGLDERAPVFHLHHDTFSLPPRAVRLASSAMYEEQAFRVGDRTWGIQFHVEWDAGRLARVLAGEAADVEAAGEDVDAILSEARRRDVEVRALAALVGSRFARVVAATPSLPME